jgi:O-antigen ligase
VKALVLLTTHSDPSPNHHAAPSTLDSVVLYGVLGLLLFGPLAFGAVEPWSIFVVEGVSASLFVVWAVRQAKSDEVRIEGNPLFAPMLVFAALICVQIVTRHTSYHYQTVSSGLLFCAYGSLCFLVVQCFRRTSHVKILTKILCIYGFSVAIFALLQGIDPDGKLYWLRKPKLGGWVYGPYVNHNHYAGLMEMLMPIAFVTALSQVVPRQRRVMAAVAAAIMASTVFLSGSRGGMLAVAVQMAILAAILIRRRRGRTTALVLGIFLALGVGLLAWLGGGQLSERLASIDTTAPTEPSGRTRIQINRDGLKMFEQKPVLGWGLGTFPTVYPQYRSFYTNLFINEAHDDYLQVLVEMGGLGFGVLLWFLVLTYRRAIRKLRDWSKDPNGAVSLAAILGISGILVHSFVDFNLQIPANAALFYVLCVVAAMDSRFSPFRSFRVRRRSDIPRELSA